MATIDPKIQAFLTMIGKSEGANYNTLYGGKTFSSYAKHPNIKVTAGKYTSTAAGKYQFLFATWTAIATQLGLKDFTPASQDLAAIQLLKNRGAYQLILDGKITEAIYKCSKEWASLPYSTGVSYYGQPTRPLATLTKWYNEASVGKLQPSGQVA